MHRHAFARPAQPPPPPIDSRELARILRPWGLSTLIAIGYVGYVAHDSLAEATRYTGGADRMALRTRAAPPAREQSVLKCVEQGSTTYSDGQCAPGASVERITLVPAAGR